MVCLKNNLFFLVIVFLLSGCQSSRVFEIKTYSEPGRGHEYDIHSIQVKASRIQQECLFYDAEAENKWRHQYYMYLLNEKNEVVPIMYSLNQDRDACIGLINKVEKILKQGRDVRLCVRDELKKEFETSAKSVWFGELGSYKIIYEPLTLQSICNSKTCFNYDDVWSDTCPGFPQK